MADYPRKPRGCPAAVREDYSWRLSFTCGRCDGRATSPSVRFAGRRVYLAVVLMLASPPGSSSGQALCELLSIPARTLKRWRTWWREDFPSTPFWQSMRERFMPPVVTSGCRRVCWNASMPARWRIGWLRCCASSRRLSTRAMAK